MPFIYKQAQVLMMQQPDRITMVYSGGYEVRRVRLNAPHPSPLTPSWYGDSVGHYEGDTLVIDTVGIKTDRPVAMLDLYGTPYTKALHVVERYRLLDYDATKEALERVATKNWRVPPFRIGTDVDPDYKGNGLQLQFTVEDEGVFTTPWSATITYRRGINSQGTDKCRKLSAPKTQNYITSGRDAGLPTATKPDF
jgi:hypothetical protein